MSPEERTEVLALVERLGRKLVDERDHPLRQHAGNKSVWKCANHRVELARDVYRAVRDERPGLPPERRVAAAVRLLSRAMRWSPELRALEKKIEEVTR